MDNLRKMLDPKNVAFIGADPVKGLAESTMLTNLTQPGVRRVFLVNPNRQQAAGTDCFRSLSDINEHVDLAVIMVPDEMVCAIFEQCAGRGVEGAIILPAGRKSPIGEFDRIKRGLSEIKNVYGTRIIGPGSGGIILPNSKLNASLLRDPMPGGTALISQSGTLGNAIFYWGVDNNIGFSMFVSLGSMIDVDFADIIDILQEDYFTKNIMLYMEYIPDAKKFLSASRCFARNKPIIVLKPGRYPESTSALISHTGFEIGNDAVYDAAFQRVGIVRARETVDFYDAARILVSRSLPKGARLAIVTNSGGLGIIACDIIVEQRGQLAAFNDETRENLEAIIPERPALHNPVDLSGDADIKTYCDAIDICIKDATVDGILVIYAPALNCDPGELGRQLARLAQKTAKPTIAVWMGGNYSNEGELALKQAGIPTYDTPEDAVRAYMYMVNYRKNIELLNETPEEIPEKEMRLSNHLKAILRNSARENKEFITGSEAQSFLQNYGIPLFKAGEDNKGSEVPAVQEWALKSIRDVDFATVILLISMNPHNMPDRKGFAVGLPPLNQVLARHLMEQAQFDPSNKEIAFNMQNLIVKFSNLVTDFPEIKEIEIETSVMPDNKIYALSAAIHIDGAYKKGLIQYPHLAIMPYPSRYVMQWKLRDGRPVLIRPIRAEDEPLLKEMMPGLSEETLRVRFFVAPAVIDHMMLMKFCNVDYDREIAMVVELTEDGQRKIIGGGRLVVEPDTQSGQFALLVSDNFQKHGIGEKMLDVVIGIAQDKALREIYGIVLSENSKMLGLAAKMGFKAQRLPDGITRVSLDLD
ncbi:MAG: Acetyl-CoA synthetase / acetyltransferase family protein [Deltaproteobacteria bacterium]|nr:Acetyl-CoA synthetase / acetyltransferase family protein [Deltaproteobacteria bacterium]